mmetsp:Transcript_15345/g.33708  ORF Transcript_15345/g.33708 Transcript_15345/m.33708 type:complete len:133 (+) Transcript_15345:1326-1724(+)
MTWSTKAKISLLGWCNVQMTVHPAEARSLSTLTTWYAAKESKPLVGSSRQTISGRVMSSTPMAVRFRCPPDNPLMTELPTIVSAQRVSPNEARSSEMSSLLSSLGPESLNAAENERASLGVEVANISSFCIT